MPNAPLLRVDALLSDCQLDHLVQLGAVHVLDAVAVRVRPLLVVEPGQDDAVLVARLDLEAVLGVGRPVVLVVNEREQAPAGHPARLVLVLAEEELHLQAVVHAGAFYLEAAVRVERVTPAELTRPHGSELGHVARLVVVVATYEHLFQRETVLGQVRHLAVRGLKALLGDRATQGLVVVDVEERARAVCRIVKVEGRIQIRLL